MIRKLSLALGFGAGYVLGAKAGKERYDQIEAKFRELMGQPAVQDLTSNVTSTASAAADKAKSTVNEKVGQVGEKVSSSSSSSSSSPSSSTPSSTSTTSTTTLPADEVIVDLGTTAPGPIIGAGASGTAPDVR